jgi:hypothetical protein
MAGTKNIAEQQARSLGRGDRTGTPLRLILVVSAVVACVAGAIMLIAWLVASNS